MDEDGPIAIPSLGGHRTFKRKHSNKMVSLGKRSDQVDRNSQPEQVLTKLQKLVEDYLVDGLAEDVPKCQNCTQFPLNTYICNVCKASFCSKCKNEQCRVCEIGKPQLAKDAEMIDHRVKLRCPLECGLELYSDQLVVHFKRDCPSETCPNCNKPINALTNLENHSRCHDVNRFKRQQRCYRCITHDHHERMMFMHEEEDNMEHRGCKALVREGYNKAKQDNEDTREKVHNFENNQLVNFKNLLDAFQELADKATKTNRTAK